MTSIEVSMPENHQHEQERRLADRKTQARPRIEQTCINSRPALRWGKFTAVWRLRHLVVAGLLIILLVLTSFAGVMLGNLGISVKETWQTLQGNGDELFYRVIMERRLPRVVMAALAGLALGASGAITQAVARNALASPDILGINTGASAVTLTLIVGVSTLSDVRLSNVAGDTLELIGRPIAALVGAFLTATVIWFLAWKKGIQTFRLVLIGMGISMLLGAYMQVLLLKADSASLEAILRWSSGSLLNATWNAVKLVGLSICVVLFLVGWLAAKLRVASLGKDSALALGEKWNHVQAALWLTAIALSAVVVSVVGPIAFIAFVAPQIALRLTGSEIQPIAISGLVGAVIVSGADLVARVISPFAFPVGIVTSGIGAPVLLYLLIRTRRKMTV
ncbi:FecCD family ABC transporter permease [Corynebacterium spheniscorum]|uniref:Iron complex transport system permease protein n=1 Tax=Corynebacterium spheniscorum TaxID=185761 RepID=A0A1I2VD06_9CORY|nr:iron chelate uptake ABC transporter family permease subunit [Corynebacterium spheniscorum]KAA8720268.1 iron chelate uptake ABC transporter family permease subunit [Corynebacterium spheniscorum]SFG86973.1 iron complex transport system permease protein [Corynebacterium spheniscorum]